MIWWRQTNLIVARNTKSGFWKWIPPDGATTGWPHIFHIFHIYIYICMYMYIYICIVVVCYWLASCVGNHENYNMDNLDKLDKLTLTYVLHILKPTDDLFHIYNQKQCHTPYPKGSGLGSGPWPGWGGGGALGVGGWGYCFQHLLKNRLLLKMCRTYFNCPTVRPSDRVLGHTGSVNTNKTKSEHRNTYKTYKIIPKHITHINTLQNESKSKSIHTNPYNSIQIRTIPYLLMSYGGT